MLFTKPTLKLPYQGWLRERSKRGGFFNCYRDMLHALGSKAGMLVCHLLNVGQAAAGPNGWFHATPAFCRKGTGLTVEGERLAMAHLEQLDIVETDERNGLRYVRIDLDRLETVVAESNSCR